MSGRLLAMMIAQPAVPGISVLIAVKMSPNTANRATSPRHPSSNSRLTL